MREHVVYVHVKDYSDRSRTARSRRSSRARGRERCARSSATSSGAATMEASPSSPTSRASSTSARRPPTPSCLQDLRRVREAPRGASRVPGRGPRGGEPREAPPSSQRDRARCCRGPRGARRFSGAAYLSCRSSSRRPSCLGGRPRGEGGEPAGKGGGPAPVEARGGSSASRRRCGTATGRTCPRSTTTSSGPARGGRTGRAPVVPSSILRTPIAEGLFADDRFRKDELVLTGRRLPGDAPSSRSRATGGPGREAHRRLLLVRCLLHPGRESRVLRLLPGSRRAPGKARRRAAPEVTSWPGRDRRRTTLASGQAEVTRHGSGWNWDGLRTCHGRRSLR